MTGRDIDDIGTRFGGLRYLKEHEGPLLGEWLIDDEDSCHCAAEALFDWLVEQGHVTRIRVNGRPWAHWWFSPHNPLLVDELDSDWWDSFVEWSTERPTHHIDCPHRV